MNRPEDLVREELLEAMAQCRAVGVDPVPILIEELETLGYAVVRTEVDWPGPDSWEPRPPGSALELCADPDCPQAWAYRDPPRDHWHPRPHGPLRDEDITTEPIAEPTRPDWDRFGLVDRDPPP